MNLLLLTKAILLSLTQWIKTCCSVSIVQILVLNRSLMSNYNQQGYNDGINGKKKDPSRDSLGNTLLGGLLGTVAGPVGAAVGLMVGSHCKKELHGRERKSYNNGYNKGAKSRGK